MIILSFEDQSLLDTCLDLQRAEQMFGRIAAEALVTFISDMLAFENALEMIDLLGDTAMISSDDFAFRYDRFRLSCGTCRGRQTL